MSILTPELDAVDRALRAAGYKPRVKWRGVADLCVEADGPDERDRIYRICDDFSVEVIVDPDRPVLTIREVAS